MKQKSVFLAFLLMVCCTMASYAQVTATGVVVDAATGEWNAKDNPISPVGWQSKRSLSMKLTVADM